MAASFLALIMVPPIKPIVVMAKRAPSSRTGERDLVK